MSNADHNRGTTLLLLTVQLLPAEETEGANSGAVQAPGSMAREGTRHEQYRTRQDTTLFLLTA